MGSDQTQFRSIFSDQTNVHSKLPLITPYLLLFRVKCARRKREVLLSSYEPSFAQPIVINAVSQIKSVFFFGFFLSEFALTSSHVGLGKAEVTSDQPTFELESNGLENFLCAFLSGQWPITFYQRSLRSGIV